MLKLLQVVTRLISSIISDMLSFGMNFVVSELTCQVETLKLTCENYTQKLDEKERELVKSVQAVHAEEWQKQHALENEKYIREHFVVPVLHPISMLFWGKMYKELSAKYFRITAVVSACYFELVELKCHTENI